MIELKNVSKKYKNLGRDDFVLKNVSVSFDKGLVCILGPSGSGKSTLLNIIGGLDRDYSGEVYYFGNLISSFKGDFYDDYRFQRIGFVFQDYNLIDSLNVYGNVGLGTFSSNDKSEVFDVLKKVGIYHLRKKKVNRLSGGERQRVAIARAIVRDPDILLLDEPTGALDSETSDDIMKLIKKISLTKLVIMVTHNEKIAEDYADRVISICDGKIVSDTGIIKRIVTKDIKFKKRFFSFKGLKFCFNNIRSKLFRNILTMIAIFISIVGVSFVFAISLGFENKIDDLKEGMESYPVVVASKSDSISHDDGYIYSDLDGGFISSRFMDYLDLGNFDVLKNYGYNFTSVYKSNRGYNISDELPFIGFLSKYVDKNYELLAGEFPSSIYDVLIKVSDDNSLDESVFSFFGAGERVSYDDLVGKEFRLVSNDNLYSSSGFIYYRNEVSDKMYYGDSNIKLRISGIIKSKDSYEFNSLINEGSGAIYYDSRLMDKMFEINSTSRVVRAQRRSDFNVLTGQKNYEKDQVLSYLGDYSNPYLLYIYSDSLKIKDYLDKYKFEDVSVTYLADEVLSMSRTLVFGITGVLFGLSVLSLIVSLVMICIITYTSSVERRREIGIFRSLGYRCRDVRRMFVFENVLVSLCGGFLAIVFVYLLINPINDCLLKYTGISDLIDFDFNKILLVIFISVFIGCLGSFIPAYRASKYDPIKCLK